VSAPPRIPGNLSPLCNAAQVLDENDGHILCPGDWEQRMPWQTPAEPPVQTYTCGCYCHRPRQPAQGQARYVPPQPPPGFRR